MSSFYESRHSYPFYTESGDYDKFTEAINDLTVWVDPDAVLPIRVVSCTPTVSGIRVVLSDYTDTFTYIMDSSTGYLYTPAGVLAGLVSWNPDIVEDIKATLEAQTPSPQDTVFVLPSLCHIRHRMPMSVVSVNGNLSAYGMTINIIDTDNVKIAPESSAPPEDSSSSAPPEYDSSSSSPSDDSSSSIYIPNFDFFFPDILGKPCTYIVYNAGDNVINGTYYFSHHETGNVDVYMNANGIRLSVDTDNNTWMIDDTTTGNTLWGPGVPTNPVDPTTITNFIQKDGTKPMPSIGKFRNTYSSRDLVVSGSSVSWINGVYKEVTGAVSLKDCVWVQHIRWYPNTDIRRPSKIAWSDAAFCWWLYDTDINNTDDITPDTYDFRSYDKDDPTLGTWSPVRDVSDVPPVVSYADPDIDYDTTKPEDL